MSLRICWVWNRNSNDFELFNFIMLHVISINSVNIVDIVHAFKIVGIYFSNAWMII